MFDSRLLNTVLLSGDQALLERTGYTLDVTTGQRKYGGPPPESAHSGAQPTIGTEVQNLFQVLPVFK